MLRRVVLICILLGLCAVSAAAQSSSDPQAATTPISSAPILSPAMFSAMSAEEAEKLGDELRVKKEYLQAIDAYEAALKKNRTAILHNKVGMTYISLGQPEKAKKAIEKAIKADKKYPEAYNNLGVVHYVLKKYDAAIKNYRRALSLREDSASFHSNLGTAYFQKRDFDRGINEYRRAYELDPQVFERSSNTGIAARMSAPEDRAQFNYIMAKLYASAGDFDHALNSLRKAMEDGYKEIDRVYKDNEFAKLRADERFTQLMSSRPPSIQQ